MRLAEYSDDEIIEELKHRGVKIEVRYPQDITVVYIGGVRFDLR